MKKRKRRPHQKFKMENLPENLTVAGDPNTQVDPLPFKSLNRYTSATTARQASCLNCGVAALENAHLMGTPQIL